MTAAANGSGLSAARGLFGPIEKRLPHDDGALPLSRLSALGLEEASTAAPRRAAAWVVTTILALLLAVAAWAVFFEIDILASGQARVIPSATVQQLSTLEGGVVTELMVKEGQRVSKEQPLVRLSPIIAQGAVTEQRVTREGLWAAIARLEAEAAHQEPRYPAELARTPDVVAEEERVRASRAVTLESSLEVLRQQRAAKNAEAGDHEGRRPQYERSLGLVTEQIERMEPLVKLGSVAPNELSAMQREQANLRAQIVGARQGAVQAAAQVAETNRRIAEKVAAFRGEAREEMARKQIQLRSLEGTLSGREEVLQRTVLKSPVDGLVKTLYITTIGGVAAPGKNIVDIVPVGDSLLIEARISPQDIAYIQPGLPAKVRITAFDSGALGSLDSVVEFISPDSQADERTGTLYYRVQVRTRTSKVGAGPGALNILPGMVAEVDIVTGRRSVMAYVLRPIERGMARALSER